jgi:formylglycine-generating enzyme required for sulfatase activity
MAAVMVMGLSASSPAFHMEWVTVGDPGNTPDDEVMNDGTTGYGGVAYTYRIGKYEVTNAQYCEFLNAADPTGQNPYYLYNPDMDGTFGGITFDPNRGRGDLYRTIPGRENNAVNLVSYYNALRFANWMHNGATPGADTEDGAYDMSLGEGVVRKPGAQVFLPTEDEWYKAAYYMGGGASSGYWDYPTQSDTPPSAELAPGTDMINGSANYNNVVSNVIAVGSYTARPSVSAYGTYDQGANLYEWNETDIYGDGTYRGFRGGSFSFGHEYMHASHRRESLPTAEFVSRGFRMAAVPEPGTVTILALGFLPIMLRRRPIEVALQTEHVHRRNQSLSRGRSTIA